MYILLMCTPTFVCVETYTHTHCYTFYAFDLPAFLFIERSTYLSSYRSTLSSPGTSTVLGPLTEGHLPLAGIM